jgi:hypothetical protein
MQRPLGITILAIVTLFWGAWSLFKGLVVLGLGGLFGAWASTMFPVAGAVVGVLALTYGVIAIILACFSLGFGLGAWRLKPWAWTLGVANYAGSLVWSLLAALGFSTLRNQMGSIVVAGAILLYLTTPDVKRAFGRIP